MLVEISCHNKKNDHTAEKKISGRYGKGLYIVSAIMTLAASGLVVFYPKFHPFQHKRFKESSGGEARVVEMFLVLNTDCEFCILDEPFSNIAPIYVEKMQELIKEQKQHKGIIVSDHLYEGVAGHQPH